MHDRVKTHRYLSAINCIDYSESGTSIWINSETSLYFSRKTLPSFSSKVKRCDRGGSAKRGFMFAVYIINDIFRPLFILRVSLRTEFWVVFFPPIEGHARTSTRPVIWGHKAHWTTARDPSQTQWMSDDVIDCTNRLIDRDGKRTNCWVGLGQSEFLGNKKCRLKCIHCPTRLNGAAKTIELDTFHFV